MSSAFSGWYKAKFSLQMSVLLDLDIQLMQSILDQIKEGVKGRVSDLNFRTWIAPLNKAEVKDDSLVLYTPNKFIADWLSDYYKDVISEEASSVVGKTLSLELHVDDATQPAPPTPLGLINNTSLQGTPISTQQPIDNTPKQRYRPAGGLNNNLSFDKFIVGSSNQFAYAATKAVSDFPGGRYNPLFIYGGVGLGKTHLLHSIGLRARINYPQLRIIYCSAEKFMNELIGSLRFERTNEFREKYRNTCDVLLIDDIQFIGGKERTQEEFFHTFNALHESQKQVVVTSDKPPRDLMGIEERLRSRFEWGLIADIQPPDLETRVAILKKKADLAGFECPDDVAMFIASAIKSNVRELEGSLIRVHAMSELTGSHLTADFARGVLKDTLSQRNTGPSIEQIQKTVAGFYKLTVSELKSPRRLKNIAMPRQIAMYLCKKLVKASYPELGGKFGGKDHTTVIHACRKIERQLKVDPELQDEIAALEKEIIN